MTIREWEGKKTSIGECEGKRKECALESHLLSNMRVADCVIPRGDSTEGEVHDTTAGSMEGPRDSSVPGKHDNKGI